MFLILLFLFCAIVHVLPSPAIYLQQCEAGDDTCVTKAVQAAYPLILSGNSEIGAEEMDPMFQKEIDGNLSIMKFKLFNSTVTGFRTCKVQNAKFNKVAESIQIEFLCTGFKLEGKYDAKGRLIIMPVEGNGEYYIDTKKFRMTVDLELNTININGTRYRHIKNFKVNAVPLGKVAYEFSNLFNGNKDLADIVLNYANQSWKEVTHEVQKPIFLENLKKIVQNANKYLKTIPIHEYTPRGKQLINNVHIM